MAKHKDCASRKFPTANVDEQRLDLSPDKP